MTQAAGPRLLGPGCWGPAAGGPAAGGPAAGAPAAGAPAAGARLLGPGPADLYSVVVKSVMLPWATWSLVQISCVLARRKRSRKRKRSRAVGHFHWFFELSFITADEIWFCKPHPP